MYTKLNFFIKKSTADSSLNWRRAGRRDRYRGARNREAGTGRDDEGKVERSSPVGMAAVRRDGDGGLLAGGERNGGQRRLEERGAHGVGRRMFMLTQLRLLPLSATP